MPRFKIGDRVLVLPQYGRFYAANAGTVVSVTPDELGRFMFDQYVVEFSPNSRQTVLDLRLTGEANAFWGSTGSTHR